MKFKDLPIGTKFLDEVELNWGEVEEMIKVSETQFDYPSCLHDNRPAKYTLDDKVYPLLMWEDEMELLND